MEVRGAIFLLRPGCLGAEPTRRGGSGPSTSSGTLGPVVGGGERGGDFPLQKKRAGLLTNWNFESILNAQVYSLWYFSACMPEELTMKKDVAASAAEAEIYLAIPHIALLTICSRLATL